MSVARIARWTVAHKPIVAGAWILALVIAMGASHRARGWLLSPR